MTNNLNNVKLNLDSVKIKPTSTPNSGLGSEANPRPYHHGDLRQALIEAGEAVLTERGLAGFSLRETARRAGVSAAAPAHHFGDARGLLTAIATRAFHDLHAALMAANRDAGAVRDARKQTQGFAYVHYALCHPARFDLMWRCDVLNPDNTDYQMASLKAFSALNELVTGQPVEPSAFMENRKQDIDPRVIATWSIVHGFASLARAGLVDPQSPDLLAQVLDRLNI